MPVQQHVLNWLYSVLTSEYHDVNRTYNDVAQALARHPTLAPRTDVHTFPSGASALLLHLAGTLPVSFRGSTYRFPISVWVPHAYPREPPLIYVTPTDSMVVRPGQHVDPQGQVYHPYLAGWAEYWDKSTIHDFLAVLSDVFAKEPPVVARQQGRPRQSPQPVLSPPPVPPLPPEMDSGAAPQRSTSTPGQSSPRPPPPPPKPHDTAPPPHIRGDAGPPLPPIPSDPPSAAPRPSRYDSAPPLPPEAHGSGMASHQPPRPGLQGEISHPPSQLPPGPPPLTEEYHPPPGDPYGPPGTVQGHWQMPRQTPAWSVAGNPPQPQPQPQQQPPAPPPPDLLDEPLTLNIPTHSSIAAPPIPPNPEKDALLRQLAQTLASIRQRDRQQNESSMAGLHAQRLAMQSVMPALQSEAGQLTQLSNIVASNTKILHDALRKADSVIEGSRSHPEPEIDELLVAPTVVSNQLYALVAEERALGDAIFMLGRAVERGRIAPAVFAKMTRSLAREWYLKKALVRKIGQGMGLAPS